MLDRGLVTQPDGHPGYSGILSGANTSQEFYAQTGYALKELPAAACGAAPTRCFAVALNTNLGASNAVQNAALAADLAWAAALGGGGATAGVYLLGHHPRCPAFSSRLLLFSPSLRAGGWSRNRRSPAMCGRASESSRGDVSAHRRRGPSAARHRRRRSSSAA